MKVLESEINREIPLPKLPLFCLHVCMCESMIHDSGFGFDHLDLFFALNLRTL